MQPSQEGFELAEPESVHRKVFALEKGSLQRLLGVPQLYAIGCGDVGSSIYYALGVTVLWAAGAAPLALLIAGLFFIFTVLTYAELSTALPESGGAQIFARRAFGDVASFLSGWAILLDYILTAAISAYTVGPYLSHFFPILKMPQVNILFTTGVLAALTGMNILGIRESGRFSMVLTFSSLAVQLLIVLLGLLLLWNFPKLLEQIQWGVYPTWENFTYGISIAMVGYIGIEVVAQLAGEAQNPGVQLPKAMILTVVTVLAMVLGMSVVALMALDPHTLSTQYLEDPIAGVTAHLPTIGPMLVPVVAALGAAILLVAANAGILGASRVAYSMGGHYQLPALFQKLHPRLKTPYASLAIFSGVAVAIVWAAREIKVLADLYAFGAMLAFSIAHLSLLGLRVKEPALPRPFKLKGNLRIGKAELPVTAILGFLATLSVWIIVVVTHEHGRNLGVVWMAGGLVLYAIYRRRTHLPMADTVEIEKLPIPEFKEIAIKKILVPVRGGRLTGAIQIASRLARDYKATLSAIHVIEVPHSLPLDFFDAVKLARADRILERAQAVAREQGIEVQTHLLQSRSAAESILQTAKSEGSDLIVLGMHPKQGTGLGGFGKIVEHILKHSGCRVWICTPPPD
ncbi:MAG: universal stress protein [Elusimicrobia bacterium]|nr:universal stress protein [Elusimicrobiota bacterium]